MCPQFCGICKPKRFPVFPRKRSDLLRMLLSRLLLPLRIFRFCVVLHRCLLRSRLHQFYYIRCMHPGQHILYFGTLNDRHFSIPCAKPKRLCSSQTGNPRSMRRRGSREPLNNRLYLVSTQCISRHLRLAEVISAQNSHYLSTFLLRFPKKGRLPLCQVVESFRPAIASAYKLAQANIAYSRFSFFLSPRYTVFL